jgi:type II secretory pathway pseudopilin PulG
MKPITKRNGLSARAGFTMIEIAIALGVIGFALVAIIGILPMGLEVQRDNRSETIINQDATFWMDAIRSGAQGLEDLTNWVDSVTLFENSPPNPPTDFYFGAGSIANGRFSSGYDIISLLTTAVRFGDTNVQAIVTAFSGSAAEKDLDQNKRELSFKYRLSVAITNAAPLVVGFDELNPQNPPNPELLRSLYELRLTLSYPYTGKGNEPRRKTYRATVSRNVWTNLMAGREYYLFTP